MVGLTGRTCGDGPNLVCHGDVIYGFAGIDHFTYICNNGEKQLMQIPPDYKSPRSDLPLCKYKVKSR